MPEDVVDDVGLTKDEFALAFEAAAGPDDPVLEESVAPPADEVVVQPEPDVPEPVVEAPPEPVVAVAPPPAPTTSPLPEPTKPEPVVEPPATVELANEDFTEEETALLSSVKENFTEVASLLDAVKRVTIAQVENKFSAKIAELEAKLSQSFAPAISVAQTVAHDKFMAEVLEVHSDARDLLPKVEEWVKTQPEFLQAAYNDVLDRGTSAQTIKLYNIFKKETGSAQVPPPPEEDQAKKEEKQKRLNAQEGVRGRHTVGRAAVDPNDFQGAFEKFAATA